MDETAGPPRAPAPGLAQLDVLIGAMRAGGLRVELRVEGTPIAVPAMVDLAALRIVQEWAAAAGGQLVCGPGPRGGFRVTARLPLSPPAAGVRAT